MNQIINAVLPTFALILLGWLARRGGVLGGEAMDALNKFVVYLALPALLFKAMAEIPLDQLRQPGFIAATLLSIAVVYLLGWLSSRRQCVERADAALDALSASYSNSGYMGIPLCLMLYGPQSLPVVALAIVMTACLLFAFTLAKIEFLRQRGGNGLAVALTVGRSLLSNPLVLAPLAGAAFALGELRLPAGLSSTAGLLGAAASPCALVCIGLFLAQPQAPLSTQRTRLSVVLCLKLLVQPALAALFAFVLFDMPVMWASIAVLLSALPTGTGPFMLAALYMRDSALISRSILWSTLLSVATVSVLVRLLPHI
ncbi:AEC family transporter [Alcaligenes sp. Marseille-Q7550]